LIFTSPGREWAVKIEGKRQQEIVVKVAENDTESIILFLTSSSFFLLLLIDEKRVKKLQEKQEKNLFPQFRRVSHIIQAHCYSTAGDDDDDDVVFDCFVVSRARAVRYQKSRPVSFFFFLS
jgi:hypothetical protein